MHEPVTRRRFLRTAGATAAMLAVGGHVRAGTAQAAGLHLPPNAMPFATWEPGNMAIPSSVGVDPRSAEITALLKGAAGRQRVLLSRECTVWESTKKHPFYAVLHNGQPVSHNGRPLTWRCNPKAVPGGGSDAGMILQDDVGGPLFGAQHRLRGWQVTVDHAGRRLNASNWSIVNYSRSGTAAPLWSTSVGPQGAPTATGWGREWVGLIRPEEFQWALANCGTVSAPNVANLKQAIPHALRGTFGMNLHQPGNAFRAPALCSDASGTGALQMGMRIRLDPAMSDAEILARRPAFYPAGYRDRWQLMLWIIAFAARDYGIFVADSTAPDLIVAQMEADASAGWPSLLGPGDAAPFYGEIIRDKHANGTDHKGRGDNAGLPLDRLQVPATSVY